MFRSSVPSCYVTWAALLLAGTLAGAEEPYQPTWESLQKHQTPEWFRDAKFGCWACWCPGVVVTDKVDFQAEWFGRQMYQENHAAFKYMRDRYGDQKQFGYKDLIPLLKGEKFDADEWAELFEQAGARFAGPLAIFHDNFPLWDSAVNRFNAKNMTTRKGERQCNELDGWVGSSRTWFRNT